MKNKKIKVALLSVLFTIVFSISANAENKTVILGGEPFGLKLFTNGCVVINVDSDENSPASKADIEKNDVIVSANGQEITSNSQLEKVIKNSNGEDIELSLLRNNETITATISPKLDDNKEYVAGMWVRDSTAGIGTFTYFDEETMSFGALGHGICDKDTGMLMPLKDGEIFRAQISGCNKGVKGTAGGLNGYFEDEAIGIINQNNAFGIYGKYSTALGDEKIEVADDSEITKGEASIFATISDEGVKEYSVEIESVNLCDKSGQNMVLHITDEELLEKTGGIIQGMSGSPIVQNGKLIGAVTHVFVNSPQKGYGISISNMLSNNI
ncbi:MAG: SpoIVB peptidase [Oscillospiraceae bacterium]|nr:SpoIVB peptidase [Candidatus Ruminococcus equi]